MPPLGSKHVGGRAQVRPEVRCVGRKLGCLVPKFSSLAPAAACELQAALVEATEQLERAQMSIEGLSQNNSKVLELSQVGSRVERGQAEGRQCDL